MPKKASEYIRVTTVLGWLDSAWYQWWLKSLAKVTDKPVEEAERISKESAAFGTAVHKMVELYLRGELSDFSGSDRVTQCAGMLVNWLKQTHGTPYLIGASDKIGLEYEVKSKKLGLVGHFDALLSVNNSLWLADFKTSNKIKKSQYLQLAAYSKMLEEEYNLDVNQGVILRVDKDPNKMPQFEYEEVHDLKGKYWPVFEKGLAVYKFFNRKDQNGK